jgi:hypothetical protein
MTQETEPNEATLQAEREEAASKHVADRLPTADEADAADRGPDEAGMDPQSVKTHAQEIAALGARVKGEGEIK